MKISVLTPFIAFKRGYKAGQVLTDAEIACWLPVDARNMTVSMLKHSGKIAVTETAAPAPAAPTPAQSALAQADAALHTAEAAVEAAKAKA